MPFQTAATGASSSSVVRHPRILVVAAIVISIAIDCFLAWQLKKPISDGSTDFKAFYTAGQFVAQGNGAGLFERSPLVSEPFTHAPYEALLFVPLSHLAYDKAVWIWCVFNIVLANLCLFLLLPYLPGVAARTEVAVLAMGVFLPVLIAEFNGQDSLLTVLMLTICFRCFARDRAAAAGAALACACFKPPLAIPMLILIVVTYRKRWTFIAGFAATGCLLLLLSMAAVGWEGILAYPKFLSAYAAGPDQFHAFDMPNVRGLATWMLQSHLTQSGLLLVVGSLSALVLGLSIWAARLASAESEPLKYALFITATILVAFHEYAYDLVLLLIPIFLVWNWSVTHRHKPLRRRLLGYAAPVFVLGSALAWLKPPIYACAIVLLFVLLCWELCSSGADEGEAKRFA